MPKEKINYPTWHKRQPATQPHGFVESDDTAIVSIDPTLFVHWEAEGGVALGLRTYRDEPWSAYDTATCWPPCEPDEIRTPHLSRGELNTLIRVLRRARDQAYGRDE